MIGGNVIATIQKKTSQGKNAIGENIEQYSPYKTVVGWLDYQTGTTNFQMFNAKLQDTTHVFLCDYSNWIDGSLNPGNIRLVINGNNYDVLMIDDPMELHQHIELYLKYVGGGLGVS